MTIRFMRGLGVLAAGAVFVTASITAQAANLIVNGDFDNTNGTWVDNTGLGSDDLLSSNATMVPGWTTVPGLANDMWIAANNAYGLTASPGNGSGYFIDLTGQGNAKPYGGIEQTITTVVGARYLLTADVGSSTLYNGPDGAESAVDFTIVSGGSSQSEGLDVSPTAQNEWDAFGWSFTATSTSTTIQIAGDSSFSSEYAGIDNVSVTQQSLPAVPEPGSLAMLLAGLAAVGGLARRRGRA